MNSENAVGKIRDTMVLLEGVDDLDALVQAIGDADFVLLGEASHGTAELYTWRAELSKKLIAEKGFSFIAVEGDWPSCYTLNRYVKQYVGSASNAREALRNYTRWPTWMWANEEILQFTQWLYDYNKLQLVKNKVGFYGIDVYSLWESIDEILKHLEKTGSPELDAARKAFACFDPYGREPQNYGVSAAFLSESCEEEVVKLLDNLQTRRQRSDNGDEALLSDELNALVAVNAERYFRSMVRGGPDSWNVRDHHMVEALERIKSYHGQAAKAIVWEHNTHIGDARATDMNADGMINVGQLVREKYGEERVYVVGFGTHRGTVTASDRWGGEIKTMKVPDAQQNSWEDIMHRAGAFDKMLLFDREESLFVEPVGHRAIGVVYNSWHDRGNYVPSIISQRYDAFIYIDESHALLPLKQEVLHI